MAIGMGSVDSALSEGWMGWVAAFVVLFILYVSYRRYSSPLRRIPSHFIVVDIETTGLCPDTDAIIEIAAIKVRLNDKNHYATHAALVDPGREVPSVTAQLTGITTEMVKGRRSINEEILDFLQFIGREPLVFYHPEFDLKFLRQAALKVGREIENPILDAVPIALRAFPRAPDHRLTTLAGLMGESADGAHRALHDCIMTLRVIQYARARELR
jgi:DNA polymerase III epsilon subunit family exonuclease